MQKVLRRTAFAEAQAARRLARRKERYIRHSEKTKRENTRFIRREETTEIKNARIARREDWELGPLAPRRDVGLNKDTYGTINSMSLRGPSLTLQQRLEKNPEGGRYANIVVGDRVVLLEGRDKGKIGKISARDPGRQEVTVEGLNLVSFLAYIIDVHFIDHSTTEHGLILLHFRSI